MAIAMIFTIPIDTRQYDLRKRLTTHPRCARIERVYKRPRGSPSCPRRRGGAGGGTECEHTPCPGMPWAGERPGRATPLIRLRLGRQVSIHVKVVGLSLASRATFQPCLLEKRLLGR